MTATKQLFQHGMQTTGTNIFRGFVYLGGNFYSPGPGIFAFGNCDVGGQEADSISLVVGGTPGAAAGQRAAAVALCCGPRPAPPPVDRIKSQARVKKPGPVRRHQQGHRRAAF
ncbi:hypothetical protein WCLP8_410017 [uncultured Gammaproteobacteria bacterium]